MKGVRRVVAWFVGLILVAVGAVVGYTYIQVSQLELPPLDSGGATVVLASDGRTPIGHIASTGSGHEVLPDDQISTLNRHANMAAEDRGFYTHGAISFLHMVAALRTDVESGSLAAGGSTITQQYVKNAYLSQVKTFERKSKEIIYAYRVERDFSKDEILDKYMNSNYYGRGAYGIDDAAKVWFGVSATKLRDMHDPLQVARAAFLAAIINQPSYYAQFSGSRPSHLIHRDELVKRQRYVLDGMRQLDGVTEMVPQSVIDKAKKLLPLKVTDKLKPSGRTTDGDSYVVSYVRDWLVAWQTEVAKQDGLTGATASRQGRSMAEAMLARGGMKIVTSIDASLQRKLQIAGDRYRPRQGLANGTVVMNPRTGGVSAIYSHSPGAQSNYAMYADRRIGSIMKTVVLTDAVRSGISPNSVLPAPAYIKINGSRIYNDDHSAAPGCKMTLADAIAKSNNPVHVELITGKMAGCSNPAQLRDIESSYPVSPRSVANLARQMGADDSLVPGRTNPAKLPEVPALALGVGTMTPVKVATIGSTLANGGTHIPPHFIEQLTAIDGKTIYQNQSSSTRVIGGEDAAVVNQTLTGVFAPGGTAASNQVAGHPMAGKTGTTEVDAWGLMYSAVNGDAPAYVCASWSGYPGGGRTGANLWGSTVMRICQSFFRQALSGEPRADFATANLENGRHIGLQAERVAPEPPTSTPSVETTSASPTPEETTPTPSPETSSPSATESEADSTSPSPSDSESPGDAPTEAASPQASTSFDDFIGDTLLTEQEP